MIAAMIVIGACMCFVASVVVLSALRVGARNTDRTSKLEQEYYDMDH